MMDMIRDGLAMVLPWVIFFLAQSALGMAIIFPLLRKRYGYWLVAAGMGALLGIFLNLLWSYFYQFVRPDWHWWEISVGNLLLAAPLLYFFRAKNCSLTELRLEKAPSNSARVVFIGLFLYLLARLFITLTDLANALTSDLNNASGLFDWGNQSAVDSLLVSELGSAVYQQIILMLQQLQGSDAVAQKPMMLFYWASLMLGMGVMVYGALRYLGMAALTALIAVSFLITLPMLEGRYLLSQWGPLGLLSAWVYLAVILILAMGLAGCERRLAFVLMPLIALALLLVHNLLLWLPILAIIVMRVLGRLWGAGVMAMLLTGAYIFVAFHVEMGLPQVNASFAPETAGSHTALWVALWQSPWSWLLIVSGVTCLLSFWAKNQQGFKGLWLVASAGAVVWLVVGALLLTVFYTTLSGEQSAAMSLTALMTMVFDELPLHFALLLALLPMCVYQYMQFDDESIA